MSKRLLVALIVVGVAALAWAGVSFFASLTAVADGTAVQSWEYLVVTSKARFVESGSPRKVSVVGFSAEAVDLEASLDGVGMFGWELVTVVGTIGGDQEFIFRRPL
jgi:hypothetical protein